VLQGRRSRAWRCNEKVCNRSSTIRKQHAYRMDLQATEEWKHQRMDRN
jgi:hypothetical protein